MIYPALPSRMLLVSDHAMASKLVAQSLDVSRIGKFHLEIVQKLQNGFDQLASFDITLVVWPLTGDDPTGSLDRLVSINQHIPVLVIGVGWDEATLQQMFKRGVPEYLPLDQVNDYSLVKAMQHAIERQGYQNALHLEKDRTRVAIDAIADAVLCTDVTAADRLSGWSAREAIDRPLSEIFQIAKGRIDDASEFAMMEGRLAGGAVSCGLMRGGIELLIEQPSAPMRDRAGALIGSVILFHTIDATGALPTAVATQQEWWIALPDRVDLKDRMAQLITSAHQRRKSVAIIVLELDRSDYLRDCLGHAASEQLLQFVSERLVGDLRSSDTVGRQGDRFVVLLADISYSEHAATGGRRLLSSLRAPLDLEEGLLHVTASLGISLYPQHGTDLHTLLQSANAAKCHAQRAGGNTMQFFRAGMKGQTADRRSLESRLRAAIDREEFLLHYQPKFNLSTGAITGCEALIRGLPFGEGLVFPGDFIPAAEDSGMIVEIGRWVMREACRQASAWHEAGLAPIKVAVNVSAVELLDAGFLERVRSILEETGFPAQHLEFELTERVLLSNVELTLLVLKELRQMGIRLALDDFGTGYSGLGYPQQYPIDVIKIDKSFVQQIRGESSDPLIVKAMIHLGKSLDILVIAEGIETLRQKEYLLAHGCAEAQGYLFSPPLDPKEFAKLLASAGGEDARLMAATLRLQSAGAAAEGAPIQQVCDT